MNDFIERYQAQQRAQMSSGKIIQNTILFFLVNMWIPLVCMVGTWCLMTPKPVLKIVLMTVWFFMMYLYSNHQEYFDTMKFLLKYNLMPYPFWAGDDCCIPTIDGTHWYC